MEREQEPKAPQEQPAAGDAQPEPEAAQDQQTQRTENGEIEDIETLKVKLQEERGKAEQYLANWQRAAADFQNYKRRTEQEREEMARLANASLIINILPILDDLERALSSVDVKLAGLTWIDGIRLIYRKFQMVLEAAGLHEIKAEGERFDPNLHEAVMEAEGEEGQVLRVVQKGYKLGDRVLRPAMVIVGRGKQTEEGREGAGEQA
ncbi:MAG TPA: nucleotide exchange factor GrpE [Dehalococcoidia bacterium]